MFEWLRSRLTFNLTLIFPLFTFILALGSIDKLRQSAFAATTRGLIVSAGTMTSVNSSGTTPQLRLAAVCQFLSVVPIQLDENFSTYSSL